MSVGFTLLSSLPRGLEAVCNCTGNGSALTPGDGTYPLDATAAMPAWELTLRILGCGVLLAFSALFSGLTLGVMGLDCNQLEVVKESGSAKDRRSAAIILPVRKQGNLLLCTLLLGNVGVNSLMAILTADLTSGLVGFVVSTFLIVILGEVIPQAACSRHALLLGARFVPVVRVIIFLIWPLAKPISMVLDWWLGEEIGIFYSRQEFHKLVMMHAQTNRLDQQEAAIMSGAVTYRDKRAKDVMTPVSKLFALKSSDRLDYALMSTIYREGYSRIPVWDDARTSIVGLLYAKDLMLIEPRNNTPVITVVQFFGRQHINVVDDEDNLGDVLKVFTSTSQLFAMVRTVDARGAGDPVYKVIGVVTMEDIMEEILQDEIKDEYDIYRMGAEGKRDVADARSNSSGSSGSGGTGVQLHEGDESQRMLDNVQGDGKHVKWIRASPTFQVDALRTARQEAAIRRLYEVSAHGAASDGGRGINNSLTLAEVQGIAAHLLVNTPVFSSPASATRAGEQALVWTPEAVQRLVVLSRVVDALGTPPAPAPGSFVPAPSSAAAPAAVGAGQVDPTTFGLALLPSLLGRTADSTVPDALFVRGEFATFCVVILDGEVEILAGADCVRSVAGPWDVLGQRALLSAEGAYTADFTARPLTPVVRFLRIDKMLYDRVRVEQLSAADAELRATGAAAEGSLHPDLLPSTAAHMPRTSGLTTLPAQPFSPTASGVRHPQPHQFQRLLSGGGRASSSAIEAGATASGGAVASATPLPDVTATSSDAATMLAAPDSVTGGGVDRDRAELLSFSDDADHAAILFDAIFAPNPATSTTSSATTSRTPTPRK